MTSGYNVGGCENRNPFVGSFSCFALGRNEILLGGSNYSHSMMEFPPSSVKPSKPRPLQIFLQETFPHTRYTIDDLFRNQKGTPICYYIYPNALFALLFEVHSLKMTRFHTVLQYIQQMFIKSRFFPSEGKFGVTQPF